jgi:hypothetical protein
MIDPILDDGYVRALAGLGALRSYAKNTVVFHEGDQSDQVLRGHPSFGREGKDRSTCGK